MATWGTPYYGPFTYAGVPNPGGTPIVVVDASDLIKIGRDMAQVAAMTPRGLESALTRASTARLYYLQDITPFGERRDTRYAKRLLQSYSVVKSPGVRQIVTSERAKFDIVDKGTRAHMIYPRHPKDALFWPGLAHPVAWARHPGTRGQHLGDRVQEAFTNAAQANIVGIGMDSYIEYYSGTYSARPVVVGAGGGQGRPARHGKQPSDASILDSLLDAICLGITGIGAAATALGGMISSFLAEIAGGGS